MRMLFFDVDFPESYFLRISRFERCFKIVYKVIDWRKITAINGDFGWQHQKAAILDVLKKDKKNLGKNLFFQKF